MAAGLMSGTFTTVPFLRLVAQPCLGTQLRAVGVLD